MRKNLVSVIINSFLPLFMIVTSTVFMSLSFPISKAQSYPTIKFDPLFLSVKLGDTFNARITISDVEDLYLYQVQFRFSAEILEVISIARGGFLRRESYTTFWKSRWNNTAGEVKVWESMIFPDPAASGSGVLFVVTFKPKIQGETDLAFYDVQLFNRFQGSIYHYTMNGAITVLPAIPITLARTWMKIWLFNKYVYVTRHRIPR